MRMLPLVVLVGLGLLAPPASADDGEPTPPTEDLAPHDDDANAPKDALGVARAQQADLRPQAALETVQAWIKEGGRTKGETRDAYTLMGELFAQLDEGAEAERAFQVVFRIDSSFVLDDSAPAAAKGPYNAALATKPEANEGLNVTATLRTVADTSGIEIALESDDLGKISDCGLVGTSTLIGLSRTTPIAFVPIPPGETDGKYAVAILDEDGNTWRVARVALEVEPPVRWLMVAGAATTFVGLLSASGLAIGYTAAAQANDEALSAALLGGVGAMSVVAAVGATMVIVDEVFLTPVE